MSTSPLDAAFHVVYSMVELGKAPNGILPNDCGPYAETIASLQNAYTDAYELTSLLVSAGRSTRDPHSDGVQGARSAWSSIVRLGLPHDLPLIEAMRQAVTPARARLGLLDMIDALTHAPEIEDRKRVALDLVDDASVLQPDEMLRLKDTLKGALGMPATWVNEWVKAVRGAAKSRKERAQSLIAAPAPTDASDDQKATWPYLAIDGRMYFCAQKPDLFGGSSVAQLPIADFTATITDEQVGEDGRKQFQLSGATVAGRSFQLLVEAEDFADDRKLKAMLTAAAGAQAPIYVGMAKHLGTAIQRLSGDIASIKRYTRTGWADGTFLMPGRDIENSMVTLSRKLPYSFSGDANLELGLQALEQLLLSHGAGCIGPVLSFLLTPPLALLAGWRNERYGAFIAGRTGSLKSSMAQALMCIYGPGFIRDDLLVKWGQGATNNALMSMAVAAYDLPFLIDNYKPNTGDGPKAFVNLIHNIVEGGEKDRLNRASELRDSRPVFAWPIVTGEDVPDKDVASLARVLVIPFTRPQNLEHLTHAQSIAPHLPAVGRAWIEWLESDASKPIVQAAAERFAALRQDWGGWLLARQPQMLNPMRVGTSLAINELTWAIAEQHPALGPLLQRYGESYYAGLTEVAVGMARYATDSSEAARYLSLLHQLIQTEEVSLVAVQSAPTIADQSRMVGYRAIDDSVYLLPEVARARIERVFGKDVLSNISNKTLYDQLAELGALASHGKDRHTVLKRVGVDGRTTRVLHLTAESLTLVADEEDDSAS